MDTALIYFEEVPLVVPTINGNVIEFPNYTIDTFPSYCGAGRGIGDLLVPETALFLKISIACYIHDIMWRLAEPNWGEFHSSNDILRTNINSVIKYKSNNSVFEHLRYYRSVTYFNSVDTVGAIIFWKIKREDGYTGNEGLV